MHSNADLINLNELSYSLRLLLDLSFIDDDWIGEFLDFGEIQAIIISTFNESSHRLLSLPISRPLEKIEKYKLKNCNIFDEEHEIYLLSGGNLLINFTFHATLTTRTSFYKEKVIKITQLREFHSYIRVHVIVQSRVVTNMVMKEIKLTSAAS